MARPTIPASERHDVQANVNFTEKQKVALQAIADYRDIPLQVLLRMIIIKDLDQMVLTMGDSLASYLRQ